MPWWVIELITNIVLVALAVGLGPFIKRFGRSYAADVFRANPRTGKSYLVLTDVAYYLIFTSFVLFTVTFVEPIEWKLVDRRAAQARGRPHRRDPADHGHPPRRQRRRVAGHRGPLVQQQTTGEPSARSLDRRVPSTLTVPPLGPGTWILRIEPAPGSTPPDPTPEPASCQRCSTVSVVDSRQRFSAQRRDIADMNRLC